MKRMLCLVGWLCAASAVGATDVELEAQLWSPELTGSALVGDGLEATTIDLAADLGFADEESFAGRLTWRPTSRVSVLFSYAGFDFAGEETLSRPLSFGGSTFQLDARVSSLLELEYAGAGIAWQFFSSRDGRLRFGPLVEARGIRGEATLRTELLGLLPLSAREEFELAFAAAGAVLDLEPTRKLHVHAEWRTAVEADEGELTDTEVGVRYLPWSTVALVAGYRRVELGYADGADRVELELDGPYLGAVLRF